MPELPEVQTVVEHLKAEGVVGRRINAAAVYWPKTVALSSPREFCRRVRELTILDIRRRAKYIVIALDQGQFLLIHLRMTGRLQLTRNSPERTAHVRVILELDDYRQLIFHDTRKFGRIYLTGEPQAVLEKLGPEPLSRKFTARYLADELSRRRRQVKPLLLDQTFLSGLGNIYVDEALWSSKIHPLRRSHTLHWLEAKSLHRAIRRVLLQAIRNAGTSLGSGRGNFVSPDQTRGRNQSQLKVFRQTGNACPRCGHVIRRIIVAQRSSHICEQCQQV